MHRILKPKLSVLWEEGYSGSTLLRDLMAGVVVAIMALPLSIAFAVASGARPEQGLITAIVAGFLGACFTGSRVQVTGPAGAFIVMVGSIITQHGYDGLLVATLMAGPILILLGFLRAGSNISFLARPVILGFTAGLSLVVFSTQIPHAVGLASSSFSSNLLAQWLTYGQGLHALNPYAVAIAALSLLITAVWPMGRTRIPGALIAVLCTAAIAAIWQLPIETLGSRFGQLTPSIPMPQFPDISWDLIVSLIGPAIS
jgi:sulfate permease, SulP family